MFRTFAPLWFAPGGAEAFLRGLAPVAVTLCRKINTLLIIKEPIRTADMVQYVCEDFPRFRISAASKRPTQIAKLPTFKKDRVFFCVKAAHVTPNMFCFSDRVPLRGAVFILSHEKAHTRSLKRKEKQYGNL